MYCISALVVYPVWLIITAIQRPLFGVFGVPHAVLVIGSGVMLARRNPRGLIWLRWALIAMLVLFLLSSITVFLSSGPIDDLYFIVGSAIGMIPMALWWAYFRRSKRVREIYGDNMKGLSPIKKTLQSRRNWGRFLTIPVRAAGTMRLSEPNEEEVVKNRL